MKNRSDTLILGGGRPIHGPRFGCHFQPTFFAFRLIVQDPQPGEQDEMRPSFQSYGHSGVEGGGGGAVPHAS